MKPVACVEVEHRHHGPYKFEGLELLDSGKHYLYTRVSRATKKAILQQALDALISHPGNYKLYGEYCESHSAACDALKFAIAQPGEVTEELREQLASAEKRVADLTEALHRLYNAATEGNPQALLDARVDARDALLAPLNC